MTDAAILSPELARSVSTLARTLVTASRSWTMYPREHPAVAGSLERLRKALAEVGLGQGFAFGVTPETLLIEGIAAPAEGAIAEAAGWLHRRDILQLAFAPEVPAAALDAFLSLLDEDIESVRKRGGPARAWSALAHLSIAIEQIDYSSVFEEREVQHPARRKDDLWRSIVRAVTDRHKTLDEAVQRRLLEIAGDAGAIAELAQDVIAPNFSADGSPMLTSQAAAVIAAYRHLLGIVEVMEPGRRAEVMQNLATATSALDPRVVLHMMGAPEDVGVAATGGGVGTGDIKRGLAEAFDDYQVAQLLATTLAIDGQATDRLAGVFDTIAPDEPRKRRVLTMTRTLLTETSFGQTNQFQTLWTSMEELLLTYNEKPFVSAQYKAGLDQVGGRAATMAAEMPEDLVGLIDTLGQDNVRRLSAFLLVDLLSLERDPARAEDVARDVAALGEDLLLAGDYESALTVTKALALHAANPKSIASAGSRAAIEVLVHTAAFHETVEILGEMTEAEFALFSGICEAVGPAAADVLRDGLDVEELTVARQRATSLIETYGARAVSRVASLVDNAHWFARVHACEVLGRIGSGEAVPLLQPLLRVADARVLRAAVRALASISDPAAARSVHTVLRAATGEQRRAVVDALVAERDPRVVPVLVCILNESEPLGADHQIVLETLAAVGRVGRDEAVPHVATLMRRRSWLARKKTRALKQASLHTLRTIGTPAATGAIGEAATNGDRLLRKLARALPAVPAHG
jgi:HEAT repeat protein